jgi:hypothetical protein
LKKRPIPTPRKNIPSTDVTPSINVASVNVVGQSNVNTSTSSGSIILADATRTESFTDSVCAETSASQTVDFENAIHSDADYSGDPRWTEDTVFDECSSSSTVEHLTGNFDKNFARRAASCMNRGETRHYPVNKTQACDDVALCSRVSQTDGQVIKQFRTVWDLHDDQASPSASKPFTTDRTTRKGCPKVWNDGSSENETAVEMTNGANRDVIPVSISAKTPALTLHMPDLCHDIAVPAVASPTVRSPPPLPPKPHVQFSSIPDRGVCRLPDESLSTDSTNPDSSAVTYGNKLVELPPRPVNRRELPAPPPVCRSPEATEAARPVVDFSVPDDSSSQIAERQDRTYEEMTENGNVFTAAPSRSLSVASKPVSKVSEAKRNLITSVSLGGAAAVKPATCPVGYHNGHSPLYAYCQASEYCETDSNDEAFEDNDNQNGN